MRGCSGKRPQKRDCPPGVLNAIRGGDDAGSYLACHPGIDKVAFTGSTGVGRRIGPTYGWLMRPVTLELGGKSAAIMLRVRATTRSSTRSQTWRTPW